MRYNPLYKPLHEREMNSPVYFFEKGYRPIKEGEFYGELPQEVNQPMDDLSFILKDDPEYQRAFEKYCTENWIYAPKDRQALHTDSKFLDFTRGVHNSLNGLLVGDSLSKYRKHYNKFVTMLSTMGLFDKENRVMTKEGSYVFGVHKITDLIPQHFYKFVRDTFNKIEPDEVLPVKYDEDPRSPKNKELLLHTEELEFSKMYFSHLPKELNEESLFNIEVFIDTGTKKHTGYFVRGAHGDYVCHTVHCPRVDSRMFREWGFERFEAEGETKKRKAPKQYNDEIDTQEKYSQRLYTYIKEYQEFYENNTQFKARHDALRSYLLDNVKRWYDADMMTDFELIPSQKVFVARAYSAYADMWGRRYPPLTISQVFDGMVYIASVDVPDRIAAVDTSIHFINELCYNHMPVPPQIKMLTRGWLDNSKNDIYEGIYNLHISEHNYVSTPTEAQCERRDFDKNMKELKNAQVR